jgi:hypothetical protein
MSTKDTVAKKRNAWQAVLVLASLLAFSSAGLIQKYFGLAGVVVNFVWAAVLVGLVVRYGGDLERLLAKRERLWVVLAAVVLAVGYCVLHPFEDGKGPGKSSDRDEGLEIALTRMVAGETPYYPDNPVAGPLSVLPGAILLAAPFVAVGDVGYQNVFWLSCFMIAGSVWLRKRMLGLFMAAIFMTASPSFLHEFVSGGDLIANGLYVPLAMCWCFAAWSKGAGCELHRTSPPDCNVSAEEAGTRVGKWKWAAAFLLGLAMASRPNFILLYPLFTCALWRVSGFRVAATAGGVAGLVSLCVIVPFYLNDPAGFTPWIARKKMAFADHVLPWAGTAMVGITAMLSLVGSWILLWRSTAHPRVALFRWCAVVTLCPMILAVAARSWAAGNPDFGFMLDRFGVMYLGFAALGWGGSLKVGG